MTLFTEILDEHKKKEKQRFLGNQSVDKTMVIAWDRYKAGLQWDDEEINKLVKLELEKQFL